MRTKINGTEIYFDVEGAELDVRDGRLVEKPTIIALHGGPGFDQGYLRPGLSALRDHAQVVYVDLRGQGRSGRPLVETCTLEQTADDVAVLCDVLGIERPVVFGHSAGGFVALHLAIRHARLVRGLILCDTTAAFGSTSSDETAPSLAKRAGPDVLAVAGRFFGGDMSEAAVEAFREKVTPYYAGPSHMDVPAAVFALSDISFDVMRHFFDKLARTYDVRPQLGGIHAPTLVIVGKHDWVCSPAASRTIAQGIHGATLVELPESGHLGFSEEPERFMDAVRGFLTTLGG
jgi:proline iminopeptidase